MLTYQEFKAGAPRRIMAALGPIFIEALDVMNTYSMRNCARTLALLSAATMCSWVSAETNGPGTTAAQPAVDWFARATSTIAIVIAVAAFIWGRVDKHREQRAAREAKDPAVDFDLTRGGRKGNYDYELKIANRGDVSLQIVSLACGSGATLAPDEDGQLKDDGRLIDYNGIRVEPGERETLLGEVNSKASGTVRFTITLRINEKTQRLVRIPITRNLIAT
jgi:hypothetical protein